MSKRVMNYKNVSSENGTSVAMSRKRLTTNLIFIAG